MPPRRRGKAASARSAAIQAVERRRRQEEPGSSTTATSTFNYHDHSIADHHHHHHHHHHSDNDGNYSPPLLEDDPDDDDDDDDDDNVVVNLDGCLHCHRGSTDIQVRCDECQAYICQTCHWCHEFQANHEIRVCDRCDAFYCRTCDEMDQCDDCGEVVCASCSTLLSCKFCGGGLCEECATACGRCGIVLCSRDAKFAVDCDTCRLSYCLVCLASGSKDPCVRCGHRPSKRMEQLVHLRLKSIYKAFKQSSRSSPSSSDSNNNSGNNLIHDSSNSKMGTNLHHSTSNEYDDHDDDGADDDPQALLHAAASAGSSSNGKSGAFHIGGTSLPSQAKEMVDKYMAEKQKADAAAQALLAELEEEEEAMKSKKTKKKKKKQRQQAKKEEERKDPEEETSPNRASQKERASSPPSIHNRDDDSSEDLPLPTKQNSNLKQPSAKRQTDIQKSGRDTTSAKHRSKNSKGNPDDSPPQTSSKQPSRQVSNEGRANEEKPEPQSSTAPELQNDPVESQLCALVDEGNIEGIEELLCTLKGVPGRAQLRKNAKKALKRLRAEEEEDALNAAMEAEEDGVLISDIPGPAPTSDAHAGLSADSGTRRPADLLKVVSEHKVNPGKPGSMPRSQAHHPQAGTPRAECVMKMDPAVVGWVIGKGGQRIRELMDQSGAKVWIDQDNKTPQDPRTVYVSGSRNCVDHAVRTLKDLVAKAPISGGANQPSDEALPAGDVDPSSGLDPTMNKQAANSTVKSRKPVPRGDVRVSKPDKPQVPATPERAVDMSPKKETHQEVGGSVHVLTCEPRFVPLLIGRRGWTIKHIQDSSGARVDIDQTVTPRRIKISGTEANVEAAIRLVRDVLSYPHAQLHANGTLDCSESTDDAHVLRLVGCDVQDQTPAENMPPHVVPGHGGEQLLTSSPAAAPPIENEERDHTPPPSSLIMTGDSKSLISASSSLSSTPEPSMASSSKGYCGQLQTGPLIPPEYGAGSFPMPSPSAAGAVAGNGFLRHDMGLGDMAGASRVSGGIGPGSSPLYGGVLGGMHQGQNYGIPSHPHGYAQHVQKRQMGLAPNMIREQHPGGFAGVPGNPLPSQHMAMPPQEPNAHLHHPTRLDFGFAGIPRQANHVPLHHQNSYGDPRNRFRRPEAAVPEAPGLQSLNNNLGRSPFEATSEPGLGPALWDRKTTGDVSNRPMPQSSPDAYYLDSLRLHSHGGAHVAETLPLNFDMPPAVDQGGRGALPGRPLEVVGNVLESGRDDSRMVDSLFGPVGTNDGGGETQAILPGFKGLSINSADVGLQGGAWGSSLPGWEDVDASQKPASLPVESTAETALFAGLQPLHNTQEQLHPSQSRFNWGSTNESVGQV